MQNSVKVKFKKLNKKAVIPTKAHPGDAGYDMTAVAINVTDKYIEYDTGIATAIPEGYVGYIFANSRVSKYDLDLCNAVGVIDSNFRNSIRFRYRVTKSPKQCVQLTKTRYFDVVKDVNLFDEVCFTPKTFQIGDVVGQLIIMPIPTIDFEEVAELDDTDRGMGGFGSTETSQVEQSVTEVTKKKRSRKKKND